MLHKFISRHIVYGNIDIVAVHSENLYMKEVVQCDFVTHPASSNTESRVQLQFRIRLKKNREEFLLLGRKSD